MIRYLSLYTFIFLLTACKKDNALDCFKGNGKELTEQRNLSEFKSIMLFDKIELNISYAPEFKVVVTAGEHVIKNISTKVVDGILKIENLNTCNFVRGYKHKIKVEVALPHLNKIESNSVSEVQIFEGMQQDSIEIRAESSGDIHLSGSFKYIKAHSNGNGDVYLNGDCKELYLTTNGTNFIQAENLKVSDVIHIETLSIGDCFLNARELNKLEYLIYNSGNVYYIGKPTEITGVIEPKASGKILEKF